MADEEDELKPIPEEYSESTCETQTVRYTGAVFWVFLGFCSVSLLIYTSPVLGVSDSPHFARTLLWGSIAHHTDTWQGDRPPPPPPSFGDGAGNYPDSRL